MKERFIEFLEKNKCLEQFKSNITDGEDFDVYCNRMWQNSASWITIAFSWASTKEGDRFWRSLHDEWYGLATKYRKEDELVSNN